MLRLLIIFLLLMSFQAVPAQKRSNVIIADSLSREVLPYASVFNCNGKLAGVCSVDGLLPYLSESDYPLTIRYLGYKEKCVNYQDSDTVFLHEYAVDLPEVIVGSNKHKILHTLAYVREYSMLTTYTDTVFLFREKMVDYMLPMDKRLKFDGWLNPRILKSNSYYRFTDSTGLDSVSDQCNHHFSWADWVGIIPTAAIPETLVRNRIGVDTIRGKYSPTEIWLRNDDRLTLDVNVLADTTSRKWVPNLSLFFRDNLDFEQFRVKFNYGNVVADSIAPIDLTGYSFNIESNGRGRGMFRFSRNDEPFFVSTYAEVYVVDKEYITVKEAKKWEKGNLNLDDICIIEPQEATELQPAIETLIDRVNNVDHNKIRLSMAPDKRLAGRKVERNFGQKVLDRVKGILGISNILGKRKQTRQWKEFRQEQLQKNMRD